MTRWNARRRDNGKRRAIIDEPLLEEFRAKPRCEWCQTLGPVHVHHLFGRGQEGCTRFDVRPNLIALCAKDHAAHHDGNRPLTLDLLAIVAQREGTTQEAIREEMSALKWRRLP